ncbi:MAG: tRNA 4-thiouridine(8) synthase ThiI [Lentisphaeria bacterium]|nr:tRNA 4-thiouridine(8) synthase ThiI [Lentisphaeria bacterium]
MYTCFICRYHEIATKGDNRRMFEEKLIDNLRYQCQTLEEISGLTFPRVRGRIYVRREDKAPFTGEQIEKITSALSRCSGLENFSPALECEPAIEQILSLVRESAGEQLQPVIDRKGYVKFRIRARRSDKRFPMMSKDIEIAAATEISKMFKDEELEVDLTHPDISVGIEVRDINALIYYQVFPGPGGLPTGSNSPVLALLSGGIDSPVACQMIMNRGCHVDFLTFHSFPYTPMASLEKVQKIQKKLNTFQKPGTLYACNLSEIQKQIRDLCTEKFRTVLYRRMMMRIANMICRRKKLNAIVTGEAVGQVASQTIINLGTIDSAAEFVMLRPLCGMDKLETIRRAEKLGTYELSIDPQPDSCTVFAPPSPSVAAKLFDIEREEAKLGDIQPLLEKAYEEMIIS